MTLCISISVICSASTFVVTLFLRIFTVIDIEIFWGPGALLNEFWGLTFMLNFDLEVASWQLLLVWLTSTYYFWFLKPFPCTVAISGVVYMYKSKRSWVDAFVSYTCCCLSPFVFRSSLIWWTSPPRPGNLSMDCLWCCRFLRSGVDWGLS